MAGVEIRSAYAATDDLEPDLAFGRRRIRMLDHRQFSVLATDCPHTPKLPPDDRERERVEATRLLV
jgi:hypothetical protein